MVKELIPRPLPAKARLHLAHEENASLRTRLAALEAQLASRTGRVKVKALDEDDYVEIIDAAANAMRRASSGARGQTITVQDSLDWWVMKETERRLLSALEPAAPEGSQTCATEGCDNPATNEFIRGDVGSFYCGDCFGKVIEVCEVRPAPEGQRPVAWQWRAYEDGGAVTDWHNWDWGDRRGWEALAKRDPGKYEVRSRPLYTRPSEQAVTEAMVEAAAKSLRPDLFTPIKADVLQSDDYALTCRRNAKIDVMGKARAAIKAAMEAGR